MKILYLVTDFNLTGGKERYDRSVIEALISQEIDVKKEVLGNISFFGKICFVFGAIFKALIFRPDFIFSAHIAFAPATLFIWKIFRIPYIVFIHGREVWDVKTGPRAKALREAERIVSVSKFTSQKVEENIPSVSDKIFILPNTLDESKFFIKEKSRRLLKDLGIYREKIILTVGRIYPTVRDKGYYRIIDALPAVHKKFPRTKYVLVGAGLGGYGDDRENIMNYALKKGVAEDLILPGRVSDEDLVDYYNLCDIFVMPSASEGFGIVFIEALACGKPVITGSVDGSREAILNGELGIFVDPSNVGEIASAIELILSGKAPDKLYNRKYLRERTIAVFGREQFFKKTRELIGLLLKK